MKKILAIVLATLALCVQAKENVTIVYGWSPSDPAANFHRALANEANKIQDKYNFMFDSRPGAGASIAAQYVLNTPDTILATSSAFFIRPNFFPNESHDVSRYRELMPQCEPPLHVVSKKYQSWREVPTDQAITIAVSGLGVTTHLAATEIAKKYPLAIIVPFKSTTDSVVSVIAGVTDFSVNFAGDSEQYVNSSEGKNKLYLLGVTGVVPDGKVPTLSSQGFPKILETMTAPAHLVVPNSISDSKFREWRDILVRAGRSAEVHAAFAVDHCTAMNQMPEEQLAPWYDRQITSWRRITSGVTLK